METHLQRKRIYLETEIKNFEDNNGNFNIVKRKIIFHRLSFLFLIYSFIPSLFQINTIPKKKYTIPNILLYESIHNSIVLNAWEQNERKIFFILWVLITIL